MEHLVPVHVVKIRRVSIFGSIEQGEKTRNIRLIVLSVATLGMLTFSWGPPGIAQAAPQTLCPVPGDKIDNNVFVDYRGERIFLLPWLH